MASTYEPIATNTVGTATASVTFSSIPATYTDLILITSASTTSATNSGRADVTVNGDTASNYSFTRLYGDGSVASSYRRSSQTSFAELLNSTSGNFYPMVLQFMNYSNTTTNKSVLQNAFVSASFRREIGVGLWRSTLAITSITLTAFSTTFVTGSSFTLYGIKAFA
jgi:hypothetical protein